MDIDLYQACADIVNQVPPGKVTTYGAVADALGDNLARRAVGVMLNTYKPPLRMPCHRVVYADGGLGGFAWGLPRKVEMLAEEGVQVRDGRIVNFEEIKFTDFHTERPLETARAYQEKLAGRVITKDADAMPGFVLGLDAAYDGMTAYGAGVLWSLADARPVRTYRVKSRVRFPYVPTYLAFREAPIYREIIGQLDEPAILMLDGNGILHPRGIGIASHLGVETNMPALGIAKKRLCGMVDAVPEAPGSARPVMLDGRVIGHGLRTSPRANPVWVSPGHLLSHETALDIARATARLKIPEPVRLAHVEATEMRRSGH